MSRYLIQEGENEISIGNEPVTEFEPRFDTDPTQNTRSLWVLRLMSAINGKHDEIELFIPHRNGTLDRTDIRPRASEKTHTQTRSGDHFAERADYE